MNGWSQGYITAIAYTHGFHRELAPVAMRMALLAAGVPHDIDPVRFRVCELGCGRGLDCNILAATHPRASFTGVDFNPTHVADARALAATAGLANVEFVESDFAAFEARDLQPFDIVLLHGVWSWVSVENRDVILRFLERHLRPGGIAYVSYNALPGWSQLQPLGRLVYELVAADQGDMEGRIGRALQTAGALRNADAHYFRANAQAGPLLDDLARRSDAYIAHEYCNRDWTPFFHADVARAFESAGLHFAASADLRDALSELDLTPEQAELMRTMPGVTQREMLRDYLVQRRLRRDIYVREGPAAGAALPSWDDVRLATVVPRTDVPRAIAGAASTVALDDADSTAALDALAAGPRSVAQLREGALLAALDAAAVRALVLRLLAAGLVEPCLDGEGETVSIDAVHRLNRAILARAHVSGETGFLASPVTGNGIAVSRHDQLFLLAQLEGHADPVRFAAQTLSRQGVQVAREGRALTRESDVLDELRVRHVRFESWVLPLLMRLKLVPGVNS